jgi:hypothetical protein
VIPASANGPFSGPSPLVGPITEQQCEEVKKSLAALPGVVSASCRRAIGMTTVTRGQIGFVYPIFEGDSVVSLGSGN